MCVPNLDLESDDSDAREPLPNEVSTGERPRLRAGMSLRGRVTAVVVSTVAVVGTAAHLIFPELKIDAVAVGLLVIAALPWLGYLFDSVEMPGGWRVQYRQRLERSEQDARDARDEAAKAREDAQIAVGVAGVTGLRGSRLIDPDEEPLAAVRRLAGEYVALRQTAASSERTATATRLFGALAALTPQAPGFDLSEALRDTDPGMRLAGYAYLYGNPMPELLGELVAAVRDREDQHFSQYWALRALGVLVDMTGPAQVPDEIVDALRDFVALRLPAHSDRHVELSRILARIDRARARARVRGRSDDRRSTPKRDRRNTGTGADTSSGTGTGSGTAQGAGAGAASTAPPIAQ